MELLAESERHKEHLGKLCAKLEALPKIVKKRRGSDAPVERTVEERKLTAKEELKWCADSRRLLPTLIQSRDESGVLSYFIAGHTPSRR